MPSAPRKSGCLTALLMRIRMEPTTMNLRTQKFYRLSKILRHALSIGVLLPEGFLRPDITFPGLIPER